MHTKLSVQRNRGRASIGLFCCLLFCWSYCFAQRPNIPNEITEVTSNFHFKIHYTLSGSSATTQQWVDSIAVYAEYCYDQFILLGWAPIPPDSGDTKYNIYVTQANWGETYAEDSFNDPYPGGKTSYAIINNDSIGEPFPKFPRLRALVAHELNHACQLRYTGSCPDWFMENTAVYMEHIIYPDINTLPYRLQGVPSPLSLPNLAINNKEEIDEHAGALWPRFLHEQYGSDVVRRVWLCMGVLGGDSDPLSATNSVLVSQPYYSTLSGALFSYAVWRYFTGSHADTIHYFVEGKLYPNVSVQRVDSIYPVSNAQDPIGLDGPGGASFLQFVNGATTLTLNFTGQSGIGVAAIRYRSIDSASVTNFSSSPPRQLQLSFSPSDTIVMVPVVDQWFPGVSSVPYSYSADLGDHVTLRFTNEIQGGDAGGRFLIASTDTISSGGYRNIPYPSSLYQARTLNERFAVDSMYKHYNWNGDVTHHTLVDSFYPLPHLGVCPTN